jgi:hypothetical protein
VCIQCDARYCLPTLSSWGPGFDEIIELNSVRHEPVKHRGRKKHAPWSMEVREPTGQFVMTEPVVIEGLPYPRVRYVGVDELECINCRERARIVLDFNPGDACPRCKTGKLACTAILY